jgi:hypothetical protein
MERLKDDIQSISVTIITAEMIILDLLLPVLSFRPLEDNKIVITFTFAQTVLSDTKIRTFVIIAIKFTLMIHNVMD